MDSVGAIPLPESEGERQADEVATTLTIPRQSASGRDKVKEKGGTPSIMVLAWYRPSGDLMLLG